MTIACQVDVGMMTIAGVIVGFILGSIPVASEYLAGDLKDFQLRFWFVTLGIVCALAVAIVVLI